jgi:hypothetical protein
VQVRQTIGELGLEKGVIVAWAEPRDGQKLKPRFGSRYFPKKLLYALLILIGFFSFQVVSKGRGPTTGDIAIIILAPLIAVSLAWPLLSVLDRSTKRNIWVYRDGILVTHARDKIVLPKTSLKEVFLYRSTKGMIPAMELLSKKGKSIVVAISSDMAIDELVTALGANGYAVQNDL